MGIAVDVKVYQTAIAHYQRDEPQVVAVHNLIDAESAQSQKPIVNVKFTCEEVTPESHLVSTVDFVQMVEPVLFILEALAVKLAFVRAFVL